VSFLVGILVGDDEGRREMTGEGKGILTFGLHIRK